MSWVIGWTKDWTTSWIPSFIAGVGGIVTDSFDEITTDSGSLLEIG